MKVVCVGECTVDTYLNLEQGATTRYVGGDRAGACGRNWLTLKICNLTDKANPIYFSHHHGATQDGRAGNVACLFVERCYPGHTQARLD
jgi:hypothetical protein